MILDNNFILDREKLFQICDAIIDEKMDLSWYCMGHAKFMKEDRLKKIRQGGCWIIEMGIESGCDRILKLLKKIRQKQKLQKPLRDQGVLGLKSKAISFLVYQLKQERV
jgi:radical SAM superfamily enzyme YgiQ (UPF0313 family)